MGAELTSLHPVEVSQSPQFLYSLHGGRDARLREPMAVTVDQAGNLYIADTGNDSVKVFRRDGKLLFSFGKSGSAAGEIDYPYGIAVTPEGNILVSEPPNGRITEFDSRGRFRRILVGRTNDMGLIRPGPLAITPQGEIVVADLWGHQVLVLNADGELLRRIGSPGNGTGQLKYPQGVAVDGEGRIWVADGGNNRVQVFDAEGRFLFKVEGPSEGSFALVRGLAVDALGRVLVADAIAGRIWVLDDRGQGLFSFGDPGQGEGQMIHPIGLFIDRSGRIYVADRGRDEVQVWGYPESDAGSQ